MCCVLCEQQCDVVCLPHSTPVTTTASLFACRCCLQALNKQPVRSDDASSTASDDSSVSHKGSSSTHREAAYAAALARVQAAKQQAASKGAARWSPGKGSGAAADDSSSEYESVTSD